MESKWNAHNRENNTKKYKVDLFYTRDIPFMPKKFKNDIMFENRTIEYT